LISPRFWLLAVLTVGAIALFAWGVENPFVLTLSGYTCAFALFALSLNVMLGGLNEVPLGQSLFFGLGAYAAGIATARWALPFPVGVLFAMAVAAIVAAPIGALTLRLTGAYFAIVSWGLSGVAFVAAINLTDITGGPLGLFGFPPLTIGPLDLSEPRQYFIACATVLLLAVAALTAVRSSSFGAALDSIRQNRHLARSVGISVGRERLKAFMLSAPIAALGGAMCIPFTQIVTPEVVSVSNTVDALLMILLGGPRLLVGPVIGAVIFTVAPYYLGFDPNVRTLVFSTAIVLIMMFAPGGLHEIGLSITGRFRRGTR
jgi:branched-chain amino acid transport system permease protein